MSYSAINITTFQPVAQGYVTYNFPSPSGSKISSSYYVANDTAPTTTAMTLIGTVFNDGRYNVTYAVGTDAYAVGVKLFASSDVYGVSLFDYDDGTIDGGISWSGSNGGAQVYTSTDNVTYTLRHRSYPMNRELWSGSIYRTDFMWGDGLNTYNACKYIKIHAFSGAFASANGSYLAPTEIAIWALPSKVASPLSGSYVSYPKISLVPSYNSSGIVIQSGTATPNPGGGGGGSSSPSS